ncbi:MAG: carboxymuconolactone decarboxylase family protein [Rhodospirillales bacterium]|nr:carboxymuconolactone decarboxylase family protein [Rhodospirillales bacterium]
MQKFQIHTVDTAPAGSGPTLNAIAQAYGFLPNLAGAMAEAPALLKAYWAVIGIFDSADITLNPAERQIVLLTASVANECSYCAAAHTMLGGMVGVAPGDIQAIREGRAMADLGVAAKTLSNYTNHIANPPLNAQFAAHALPARKAS